MLSHRHNSQLKAYRFQNAMRCFQIDRQPPSLSRAITIMNLHARGRAIYRLQRK